MALITLKDFSVYYKIKKEYWIALEKINLEVNEGEFLVVVGESGCGKTTLLKSILGNCDFTEGEIMLCDTPIKNIKPADRNFAYISQEYSLYPTLTVYENIAFPLRMMKTTQQEVDHRVREIAQKTQLELLLSRKPKHLSGGQQQRVAIARALVKNPRVLLFDEPFSNQHEDVKKELRALVKSLQHEQNTTAVYVTHDLTEAATLADRMVVFRDGKIEQAGTYKELRQNPANDYVKGYLL